MTKGGLFSYLRAYLTHITPYKLFIRLFFVEKQKLVVHPHKNVQRVFCYLYWEFWHALHAPSHSWSSISPPSGSYIYVEVSHVPTAALLRSLQWVSWYRSRSAGPAAHTQLACVRGRVATARRHSLLCLHSCSFIFSPINCNSSTNSKIEQFTMRLGAQFLIQNSPLGSAACLSKNS